MTLCGFWTDCISVVRGGLRSVVCKENPFWGQLMGTVLRRVVYPAGDYAEAALGIAALAMCRC